MFSKIRIAIIIFGLSLVYSLTLMNAPAEYKLMEHINNDVDLRLEKHLSASIEGIKSANKNNEYTFLSDVQVAEFPFTGLGMSWEQNTPEGTHVDMEVRFFDGIEWGAFNDVSIELIDNEAYGIITTNPAESFQYRLTLSSEDRSLSPEVKNIEFTYINANDKPIVKALPNSSQLDSQNFNTKSTIVKRSRWGANEDLRLFQEDNPEPILVNLPSDFYIRFANELKLKKVIEENEKGQRLTWPLQYPETISKIVVHHTATTKDLDDPAKAIRDIYYYHAIAKGWGDIGYNYIIDQNGNIYEGRYGGEGVVGAHAGPGNRGSIGIAVLGNFNNGQISAEAKQSLENLIAEKTKLHGIDPKGSSYFRGEKYNNVMAHGDIMNTSCPGENLEKLLPSIRNNVVRINGSQNYQKQNTENAQYAFEYIPTLDEITLSPEKKITYAVKIKNIGTETWNSKTKLIYEKNEIVDNGLIVNDSAILQKQVKPGEIGTFKVQITSKLKGGFYYTPLKPIFNGSEKSEQGIYIPTIVEKPKLAYKFEHLMLSNTNVKPGEKLMALVVLKNTGNVNWKNFGSNRISLGSDNPKDRISLFTKSTRLGYLKESVVAPGEEGHFIFNLTAPKTPGKYEEYFTPVIERLAWLDGKKMKITINVKS